MSDFDIFGLQETWDIHSEYSEAYFQNHVRFECNAIPYLLHLGDDMGGISGFVHNRLVQNVKRVATDFTFGVLLILDKLVFGFDNDVLYASLYIPPDSPPVYSNVQTSVLQQLA